MAARWIVLCTAVVAVLAGLWWVRERGEARRAPVEKPIDAVIPAPTAAPPADRHVVLQPEPALHDAESSTAAALPPAKAADQPGVHVLAAAGVLEVEVWLEGRRQPDALVSIRPAGNDEFWSLMPDDAHPDAQQALTNERGLARFADLPAEDRYFVRVHLGEITALRQSDRIEHDEPAKRVVFELGSGGVEGRVYHDDGTAWPLARIVCDTLQGVSLRTTAGEDGLYRLPGLTAGFVMVIHRMGEMPSESRSANVVLEPGGWKRVDFGSDQPRTRWTGRVVSSAGDALALPLTVELVEVERGNEEVLTTEPDGRFELELVPGRYRATSYLFDGARVLGEIALAGPTHAENLVVPGRLIHGHVTYVGEWPDKALPAETAQIWLTKDGDQHTSSHAKRDGDRYYFVGVEPGAYHLTTHPQALVGGDANGIPVVIEEGTSTVEVDLTIQDPL